jgi:hypothetical protein
MKGRHMSLTSGPDTGRLLRSDQSSSSPSHPELPAATEPDGTSVRLIVVNSRGGDGLGISFKVEGSGRVFRLEPTRDPNQPRFWCFRIYRCTSTGVVSQDERSWWGPGGMTRPELPAAVQAIRTDPDAWLANEALAELREWILGTDEDPSAAEALLPRRAKPSRP